MTVPLRLTGTWHVSVVTDALGQVAEPDTRANNTFLPPADIALTSPFADLQVEVAVAPAQVIEGTPLALSWRVRNAGDGATDATQWQDAVYLSTDSTLDAGDLLLGARPALRRGRSGRQLHGRELVDLKAPLGIPGTYYVLIDVDHLSAVYEGAFDGQQHRHGPRADGDPERAVARPRGADRRRPEHPRRRRERDRDVDGRERRTRRRRPARGRTSSTSRTTARSPGATPGAPASRTRRRSRPGRATRRA